MYILQTQGAEIRTEQQAGQKKNGKVFLTQIHTIIVLATSILQERTSEPHNAAAAGQKQNRKVQKKLQI
jgi:hypothetical protein